MLPLPVGQADLREALAKAGEILLEHWKREQERRDERERAEEGFEREERGRANADERRRERDELLAALRLVHETKADELARVPYIGEPAGFYRLVRAESRGGELPVLLLAPIECRPAAPDRSPVPQAVALGGLLQEACAALGVGGRRDRMSICTGYFRRPLEHDEWDLGMIRIATPHLPVILVYGHLIGSRLTMSIGAWNVTGPPLHWLLPAVEVGPGAKRDPLDWEPDPAAAAEAVGRVAVYCAALCEMFHLMRGRLPTLHQQLQAGSAAGGAVAEVADLLTTGLAVAETMNVVGALEADICRVGIDVAAARVDEADTRVAKLLPRITQVAIDGQTQALRLLDALADQVTAEPGIAAVANRVSVEQTRLAQTIIRGKLKGTQ